ncbi:MAG TPA: protease inhibitor I42 family protein [Candidatus Rubrimentiphilum sp.]|nr:protease inhibitor I42 family protein [Candidatus Rubrimentiphilum sp.]
MKTVFGILFALAFAAPVLADPVNTTVNTDPSKTVTVKKGQEFLIALPSNPSTGYSWTARPSNADVSVFGSAFQRNPVGRTIVGAGGEQIWVLEATQIGTAKVVFSYSRPWLKNTLPARTQSFTIKITR